MNKMVDTFENRLKYAMDSRGVRQVDIANNFNWSRSTVSQYCDPELSYKPKADRTYMLAEYLNVSPLWLMGYDVPMNGMDEKQKLIEDINKMDNAQIKRLTAYMRAFSELSQLEHEEEQELEL